MTTSVDKKQVDEEYAKAQALVLQKQQERMKACADELTAVLQKHGFVLQPQGPILVPKQ